MINYSGLKRIAFPTQAPDPYTPFIQAVQGLAGRAPQMSADMQRQEANKYRRAALDRMVQGAGMQAPQMEQGMDGKQALGVLLASLFGRALGANPGEVNDFVAGFTQARQNQASQANEQKMREFEMQQRQNQVLSQADLGYADIANDEANRLQGYIDRDRANADAMKTRQSERDWWTQQETMRQEGEAKKQAELTNRAMIRDPRKVEAFKALGKTSEGRAKLVELAGMDADAAEAARQLTEQELLTQAKTQTENAMRGPKVAKVKAETTRILGAAKLDNAKLRQVEQRIAYYPLEYQAKVANTYSLIEQRTRGKVGTGENYYYGKGDETALRSGLNSAKQTIAAMNLRTAGGPLSAEDAETLRVAEADAALFARELEKVKKAKTERVRKKYSGPGIDTSGGFEPFVPPAVNAAKDRFAGAKAKSGGKTRSGSSFTFEPD